MGKIITIGREFGSGGREVGKRLSDELGIAYYDNEIITEIAKRTELAEGYVQHVMENGPTALMPITIGRTFYMGADPVMEQNNAIYREQSLFCLLYTSISWKERERSGMAFGVLFMPVSYTHLDVYKRQMFDRSFYYDE